MADLIEGGRLESVLAAGRELPPPDPFVGLERWADRSAPRLRGFEPVRLATLFRGAAGADLPAPDQIAALDIPTLILAWTGDPGHPASTAERLAELLPEVDAQAVVDIACGQGIVARYLAAHGASVVAIDSAEPMIANAVGHGTPHGREIRYAVDNAETLASLDAPGVDRHFALL